MAEDGIHGSSSEQWPHDNDSGGSDGGDGDGGGSSGASDRPNIGDRPGHFDHERNTDSAPGRDGGALSTPPMGETYFLSVGLSARVSLGPLTTGADVGRFIAIDTAYGEYIKGAYLTVPDSHLGQTISFNERPLSEGFSPRIGAGLLETALSFLKPNAGVGLSVSIGRGTMGGFQGGSKQLTVSVGPPDSVWSSSYTFNDNYSAVGIGLGVGVGRTVQFEHTTTYPSHIERGPLNLEYQIERWIGSQSPTIFSHP